MKVVRLHNNVVAEIIPEYALPVIDWYGESFAKTCVEAPDDVKEGYIYNPESSTFKFFTEHPAGSTADAEAPTEMEQLRADVDYLLMMTEG